MLLHVYITYIFIYTNLFIYIQALIYFLAESEKNITDKGMKNLHSYDYEDGDLVDVVSTKKGIYIYIYICICVVYCVYV
jgi:hypothetical protein